MKGLIVVRGAWDPAAGAYELSHSRPVVVSDLLSSRGVAEPHIICLASGRIVVVFRGSNVISRGWNTRIQPGTPAHKWFTYSDDGGQTFTEAVPWHYTSGEVFYSPASIARFHRWGKNGRAYWFGNITGPEAFGNSPRYPLVMAEVDEETGLLKKETLLTIDDRDPEVDSEKLQLSNFTILEDRENGRLELSLARSGSLSEDPRRAGAYTYYIDAG
jgi:hypothetical protein